MVTLNEVADVLDRINWAIDGRSFKACCPAHADRTPSLQVSEWNGRIKVHCHTGCASTEIFRVLKEKGIDLDTGYDKTYTPFHTLGIDYESYRPPFDVDHSHVYYDSEDKILGARFRGKDLEGKKTYITVTPHQVSPGKFVLKPVGFPHPAPLYGLNLLACNPDKPVLIVEGEKAADTARILESCKDYVVVSWPDGVSSVRKTDWSPLAGRDVLIWPDNDAPGKKAAEQICRILDDGIATSAAVVDLPYGLPKKFDLGDPIPENLNVAKVLDKVLPHNSALSSYLLSAFQIKQMVIPERENIVDAFLKTSSINMLYATRGIGKTWFCLLLAYAISRGEPFLGFDVPKKRGVIYIDGEMPLADIKERLEAIKAWDSGLLRVLPSESFHTSGKSLNIQSIRTQEDLIEMLEGQKALGGRVDVVILDNLSSLSAGTDENDNAVLDQLLKWLVQLRHMGYAILIVHHAGKSGDQRGASRREDLLDVVIKLGPVDKQDGTFQDGKTQFRMEFTKHRHKKVGPDALDVTLEPDADGRLSFSYAMPIDYKAHYEVLRYIAASQPKTQAAIAEAMAVSKGKVSGDISLLRKGKYLAAKELEITPLGWAQLKHLFPEYKDIATETSLS